MEAHTRTPRDLFEGNVQYEIPAFQRPYVWNEDDQWEPLWRDVTNVAAGLIQATDAESTPNHFLGAVVAATSWTASGDVVRRQLIDGQQRMTTLQLLLDALRDVVLEHGHEDEAEALEDLVRNRSKRFAGDERRFKLWPSETDRRAFVEAMDEGRNEVRLVDSSEQHRLAQAHRWFRAAAERWVSGHTSEDEPPVMGSEEQRICALRTTLEDRLTLVAIDLDNVDDAQLIFETLNDRGTPLLGADLIKNWFFHVGKRQGTDVGRWAKEWAELDSPWWREPIRQGRLTRPRVDVFFQYWLTAQTAEDLRANEMFRHFVRVATSHASTRELSEGFLHAILTDAALYRSLDGLSIESPEGRFCSRVLKQFDQAALTPLVLRLAPERYGIPDEQRRLALESVESWVVRRALLFLSTKATNRVLVSLLKRLHSVDPQQVGTETQLFLAQSTSRSQIWPSDAWLQEDLLHRGLYGGLRRSKLCAVLEALEHRLRERDSRFDLVVIGDMPQIEHIMPQSWEKNWTPDPPLSVEQTVLRHRLIHTLGNLALVNGHLNASLSNRPWTDAEAAGMNEGGHLSEGKRSLLDHFSGYALTRDVVRDHPGEWTDDDILARSRDLVDLIIAEWPGPVDPKLG
jgi:Uncharacterized conserved protein